MEALIKPPDGEHRYAVWSVTDQMWYTLVKFKKQDKETLFPVGYPVWVTGGMAHNIRDLLFAKNVSSKTRTIECVEA